MVSLYLFVSISIYCFSLYLFLCLSFSLFLFLTLFFPLTVSFSLFLLHSFSFSCLLLEKNLCSNHQSLRGSKNISLSISLFLPLSVPLSLSLPLSPYLYYLRKNFDLAIRIERINVEEARSADDSVPNQRTHTLVWKISFEVQFSIYILRETEYTINVNELQ